MIRTYANAVYNLPVPQMFILSPRSRRAAASLLFVFVFLNTAVAADWSGPAEQLARKIVAVTGPGAAAVDFANRSSLAKSDFEDIRRQLLTQLASMGLRFVNAEQAAATVQISLSENIDSYLWVAEIHQGNNESSVVMISLPRPETASPIHDAPPLTIHKTLLWSEEDQILDVAVLDGNPAHLIVLDPNRIALYRFQDGRWQPEQTLGIIHSRSWPRDLRGRLVVRKDHLFDAYLPGMICQSSGSAPLGLTCHESDDPWPLGTDLLSLSAFFTPARNFFTGVLAPGVGKQTTAPAFYSAAALPREKYTLWLFATTTGQIHLLDGVTDQTAGKLGWGSDIASLRTSCGSGWQVLATSTGDGPNDSVRAFEIADREPAPVSQLTEFNGTITALWTETAGSSAIAVSRNSEMGRYEAFRLTITCGQ